MNPRSFFQCSLKQSSQRREGLRVSVSLHRLQTLPWFRSHTLSGMRPPARRHFASCSSSNLHSLHSATASPAFSAR